MHNLTGVAVAPVSISVDLVMSSFNRKCESVALIVTMSETSVEGSKVQAMRESDAGRRQQSDQASGSGRQQADLQPRTRGVVSGFEVGMKLLLDARTLTSRVLDAMKPTALVPAGWIGAADG
jgi:hypothetical protein